MRRVAIAAVFVLISVLTAPSVASGAAPPDDLAELCEELYGDVFSPPTSEPLAGCQWNMALIGANDATFAKATGDGVRVGVIDSGIDLDHPDLAANIDLDASCSFIFDHTPTALAGDIGNGDCSNNAAVQDFGDHGTHVATTIAAPINGIGIAGVAPDATIVGLKACTAVGFCFADSVAAALRHAGDERLDIVNLSLFADPYLYYCGNNAEQRAIYRDLAKAAKYAQQQGVLIIAAAGNQASDLRHPGLDTISPDWPPGSEEVRDVGNNCRVAPAELPGVVAVMSTGPIGYPGYDLNIADYSTVGGDVAAPGGDYFQATGTVQDAILAGMSATSDPGAGIWAGFDALEQGPFPGLTSIDSGGRYGYLNGTSMASPHAAGVAALIVEQHPNWSQGAVKAALLRTAVHEPCPEDWEPLNEGDERLRCYGGNGHTSFFGHGVVSAANAVD